MPTPPAATYELTIDAEFCAAHAIVIRGRREPVHGHNWHVTVTVAGHRLDEDGLLCDFHVIEQALHALVARFHNRDLNSTPPFDRMNPTAELIAAHLGESLTAALRSDLPAGVRIAAVRITEAPGCAATWRA